MKCEKNKKENFKVVYKNKQINQDTILQIGFVFNNIRKPHNWYTK